MPDETPSSQQALGPVIVSLKERRKWVDGFVQAPSRQISHFGKESCVTGRSGNQRWTPEPAVIDELSRPFFARDNDLKRLS